MAGLLLASRDIVGGIEYVKSISDQGSDIPSLVKKINQTLRDSNLPGRHWVLLV